jgi:hypothetical protein
MARPAVAAHRARPLVAGWRRGLRAPASETAACALEGSPVSVEGDAPSGPGELQLWEGAVVLCSWRLLDCSHLYKGLNLLHSVGILYLLFLKSCGHSYICEGKTYVVALLIKSV